LFLFTFLYDTHSILVFPETIQKVLPTVAKICQDSGFSTGDIRIFVLGQ